jgi:hypothetical protein
MYLGILCSTPFSILSKSKNKFNYEFKFVDVSKSGKKIDFDKLCEMFRKVLDDIEMKGPSNGKSVVLGSKSLH